MKKVSFPRRRESSDAKWIPAFAGMTIFLGMTIALLLCAACAKNAAHPVKLATEDDFKTFSVRGEILWKGETPVVYPIPTTAYQGACGKRQAFALLNLKKDRTWHKRILNVAVWLEPVWEEMTPEEIEHLRINQAGHLPKVVTINERKCLFEPDMLVVPVGTKIEVVNRDRKDHWFIIEGDNREREQFVQYNGDEPTAFTFETPGVHTVPRGVPVEFTASKVDKWHLISGFHRWMDAWIIITDKIWFDDNVNRRGIFEISNVPRGVYRVNTWHPLLGMNSKVIKVPEDVRELVSVGYNNDLNTLPEIPSTVINTTGEVRGSKQIWNNIEEW